MDAPAELTLASTHQQRGLLLDLPDSGVGRLWAIT
jgi:hypothetical protein